MQYQNLDLWVERQADGTYLIQGKSSQGDFRENASIALNAIVIDRDAIAEARIDAASLKELGTQLFTFLFRTGTDEKLASLLDRTLGAVSQAEHGLRIRIQLDEANPDIAALPWEFLYRPVDACFLATRLQTPLVRFLEVGVPLRKMEAKLPLSMLVVVPAVEGLNVDLEVSLVEEAVGGMANSVRMTVLQGIVTPERLQEELLKHEYDVLHFVGHGDFDGDRATLRFNDPAGRPQPVDHVTLGKMLQNELTLRLVVLNSCKGAALSASRAFVGMAPRLIGAGIPAVVAMQYPIRDDEALCFVKAFYGALFDSDGRGSVDFAICTARNTLETKFAGGRSFGVPVLFMRYEEGILFRLVTGSLLRDAPYSREDARREEAVIREMETSHRKILAASGEQPTDETTKERLASQGDELARAKRRLRFRNRSVVAGAMAALVATLAFSIGLLDRLPLSWIVAASPVWFGDPVSQSLDVSSIAIVTAASIDTGMRPRHAMLVDRLSEAGARVIVLDIFFQQPRPADDSVLAAAFARAAGRGTRVVFGARDAVGGQLRAVPALAAHATIGNVCLGENRARFSGIVPLIWVPEAGGTAVPSLALTAVAALKGARFVTDLDQGGVSLIDSRDVVIDRVRATRMVTVTQTYENCPLVTPGSRYGEMLAARAPLVAWRDPARRMEYATVLAGGDEVRSLAGNRIVLVGATAPGELSSRPVGLATDERYGVERHADAIATILSNAEVLPLGGMQQLAIIVLGAAAGGVVAARGKRGKWLVHAAQLAAALVGLGILAAIAYRAGNTLVDILYPSVALLLSYAIILRLRRRWLP